MKNLTYLLFLIAPCFLFAQNSVIQNGNSINQKRENKAIFDPYRWRVGGNVGLDIGSGDYLGLSISPRVGYQITSNFEAGVGVGYQYLKRKVYNQHLVNFGPYLMYYPFPQFFARAEYDHYTGTIKNKNNGNSRHVDDDALWLGAGYHTPGRVSFHFGVMYNVLQSDSSLFRDGWRPFAGVSMGI